MLNLINDTDYEVSIIDDIWKGIPFQQLTLYLENISVCSYEDFTRLVITIWPKTITVKYESGYGEHCPAGDYSETWGSFNVLKKVKIPHEFAYKNLSQWLDWINA